ncbi:uncharacterized protein LOC130797576 isoform X4 [Amaranthus tricolor]|uniref:uncharacterized protein LOC130797576 isoform X4 n=1 Tax=Amaranthus tricolor TaxID=29722 RepID=UPI0025890293|nr:uncharacterized protein LOC130797576 isoform X4 [Amaranthus tricolor]
MGSEAEKKYADFQELVKRTVYLDNLSNLVTDSVIRTAFEQYGMPRPVRGRPAEPEMFEDRPPKPGRKIQLFWMDPKDPDFEVAEKLKHLARKHIAEESFLQKKQRELEEDLSKQQAETLKGHYKKFELMDSVLNEGTSKRLAKHYGVNINDDKGI